MNIRDVTKVGSAAVDRTIEKRRIINLSRLREELKKIRFRIDKISFFFKKKGTTRGK